MGDAVPILSLVICKVPVLRGEGPPKARNMNHGAARSQDGALGLGPRKGPLSLGFQQWLPVPPGRGGPSGLGKSLAACVTSCSGTAQVEIWPERN